MKRLAGLFLLGLATVLPVALLAWLVTGILAGSERLLGTGLEQALPPGWYFPGMGLLAGILLLIIVGLIAKSWIGPPIGRRFTRWISGIPLLGRLFLTIRDIGSRIAGGRLAGFDRVVFVAEDGGSSGRLGLVADDRPVRLSASRGDLVPVYFPGTFQPGGELFLIPADHIEATDLDLEDGFRLILSGGLSRDER